VAHFCRESIKAFNHFALHQVPCSCVSFCTFGHLREPKMADIAHNYYGSLRLPSLPGEIGCHLNRRNPPFSPSTLFRLETHTLAPLRRSTLLQLIFFPNLNTACLAQANAAHRRVVQCSFVCQSLYSKTIACLWPWPNFDKAPPL
jgi:hypothetical protein